ncbi:1-deoxy-D-xylulose-5-phosphate reductoisomerase [Acidiphilium acidophilum]|uniref:1-deoxy-D-xylulose 5-phosphate reductoisomerase n=1 Tax=Acidiphilium acidophilum TaxID=76588 RepID=A0AAW9DMM1_ACIAO|nr:1-deoxy-D-xylulose-5-phosphate reductoisomerase [Acidiphilium acidophilum]MDX5929839.1 1-deoxy-D-xylulose-5-phosphate reductoisomerase [Acidiphilium acidophilum]
MAVKTVTILGSTGSVGTQTIDLLMAEPDLYRVNALIAGRNATLLAEQARALRPDVAVIADEAGYPALRDTLAGSGIRAEAGREAVIAVSAVPTDWTMAAITGTAGLEPTLAAARNGRAIALANKEALVSAGAVFLRAIADAGAMLLPVDSEHNAIFQSLADGNRASLEKIILTASGGPFRDASLAEMRDAPPERALKHPVWSMGAKISIDSATLFNKGLEVIEAARIFALAPDEIEVLVHPQSIIHGMVCYRDGSVLAQMGAPDMRIPIAHTLAWPARVATTSPRLDLAAAGQLSFFAPDPIRFPALRLAREALEGGEGASTVLNAANEIAVAAYLAKRIGFLDIATLVERVMQRLGAPPLADLAAVLALDAEARAITESELTTKFASRAA